MRKINLYKFKKLQLRREKKRLKRLKINHIYSSPFLLESKQQTFTKKVDKKRVDSFNFNLDNFLNENGNQPSENLKTEIEIPENFSLEIAYSETILTISLIRKSLLHFLGHKFIIDFTNCKHAEFTALFLLKVMLEKYLKELRRLDKNLITYKAFPDIKIQHSTISSVNAALVANGIIKNADLKETDFIPVSLHNMITGRKNQKHYHENKKGPAVTSLRRFINSCLQRHNVELNEKGDGFFDGLISEILNNAEDHSFFDTWYAFANLFETKGDSKDLEIVGEINFAFLNFGYSIYEGFEKTKNENHKIYNEMSELTNIISKLKGGSKFTVENLFTLYALQDGNSRLKYDRESRGTGTMKFINSFLNLGDYQDNSKGYIPRMVIYSGSTMLKCDNTFMPFDIEGANYLSLNTEKNMLLPPEASHLSSLSNRFPGTLITGKIYLNEKHLKGKINNEN